MKKLLLLLLVLAGGVSTVSAETKRIYVNQQISGWTSNINTYGLNLFLEKNGTAITSSWPGSAMTKISDGWFYIDIDSEEAEVTACLICPVTGNYWYVGEEYRPTIDLSKNNVLYLYEEDSKAKISGGIFTGYAIANGNTASDNTLQTLTQNGLTLTGILDLSSAEGSTKFWVFPTILSDAAYYRGEVAMCPSGTSDYALSSFAKQSGSIVYGNSVQWEENTHQKYNVSIDLSTGDFTFIPYREATIGDAGYISWSNAEKYKVSGAIAYTVKDMGTYAKLTAQEAGIVYPAGTALLLGGSGTVTIEAVASDAATATITDNNLLGSGNAGKALTEGDYVLYWDGTNASSVCFKVTTGGTLAAHKAYLPKTSTAREFLSFVDEAAGISENAIVNSDKDAQYFDLSGRRVAQPTKGLYIKNGKKVIMK